MSGSNLALAELMAKQLAMQNRYANQCQLVCKPTIVGNLPNREQEVQSAELIKQAMIECAEALQLIASHKAWATGNDPTIATIEQRFELAKELADILLFVFGSANWAGIDADELALAIGQKLIRNSKRLSEAGF